MIQMVEHISNKISDLGQIDHNSIYSNPLMNRKMNSVQMTHKVNITSITKIQ